MGAVRPGATSHPRVYRSRTDGAHLEGGPAPGAVAALKTLEELRVIGLVRVDVETQIIVREET